MRAFLQSPYCTVLSVLSTEYIGGVWFTCWRLVLIITRQARLDISQLGAVASKYRWYLTYGV